MASFSLVEFVGNGVLKGLLPKLLAEGWDDVPTLKIMNSEDMNALNMTQQQKVKDFWPRYWGGAVLFDQGMQFFKALGGGKLLKDKFISGFIFNPRAIANYKRAKAMGIKQNLKGEGEIKGGLFIIGSGKSGIAYQFIERNFGDWAPLAEAIQICTNLQNQQPSQGESSMGTFK
ncbi:hypothetical protein F2P56_036029 [Juglans regia]|uniref:Peroxiredoxin-like 2A n=1 Tax=Juglans regia TaxID=51240 RepID=A0A833U3F3_JUGRE|nr:hypothetical protein F2P56_036029 [Juglans regia]